MKELKNIDRLFQEKFRDFEQTPSPHIWKNISASLTGKTKKDNKAFWLWFSGIAAGLALLLLLNNPFNQTDKTDPYTTGTNETPVILKPSNSEVTQTDTNTQVIEKQNNSTKTTPQKQNAYSNKTTLKFTNTNNRTKTHLVNPQKQVVVINANNVQSNTKTSKTVIDKTELANNIKDKTKDKTIAEITVSKNNKQQISKEFNKQPIKIQPNKNQTKKQEELVANHSDNQKKLPLKESLSKKINEDDFVVGSSPKKWNVSTTIAPVYFNTFNENTSSFGNKYDSNTKQGQFSTAYGVQLAYQVNDRFTVQTGLHKVDYGYKTNEVYVSPNKFAENSSTNIVMNDIININDFHAPPNQFGVIANTVSSGSLLQVFGYYEIPIELKYQLVKGKIDIDVVSGFSTLIRSKDEIYYQIDNFSEKIDATSNLNPVNLTGNIGLEANYKINKKVSFSITPMFKVHANTFTKEAGKSNPYALGVYSGLNYRF